MTEGGSMTIRPLALGAALFACAGAAPAAGAGAHPGIPKGVRFVARVSNPWFPLLPGSRWIYTGVKDGKGSRDVVTVVRRAQTVDGVKVTVVHDRLYLAGRLEERTTDYYAQDTHDNVWYLGEDTAELDAHGKVTTRSGTWRVALHDARAGIYMPGHPRVGQTGRQEYLKGQAEDHFRVRSLAVSVHTPGASSNRALLAAEWTPLEPGVLDHKYYVRGIGTVLEKTVRGGDEVNRLVSFHRG